MAASFPQSSQVVNLVLPVYNKAHHLTWAHVTSPDPITEEIGR